MGKEEDRFIAVSGIMVRKKWVDRIQERANSLNQSERSVIDKIFQREL